MKPSREQKWLGKRIDKLVENSVKARYAQDDETNEKCAQQAESNRIIAALGPPGTGKTWMVNKKIKKWRQKGDANRRGNLNLRVRLLVSKSKCRFIMILWLSSLIPRDLLLPVLILFARNEKLNTNIL